MLFKRSRSTIIHSSASDHLRIYRIDGDVDVSYLEEFGQEIKTNFPAIRYVAIFVAEPFEIKHGTTGRYTVKDYYAVHFARIHADATEERLYALTCDAFPEEYFPSLDPPAPSEMTAKDPSLGIIPPAIDAGKLFGDTEVYPRVDMDFGRLEPTPLVLNMDVELPMLGSVSDEVSRDVAKRYILDAVKGELAKNFDKYFEVEFLTEKKRPWLPPSIRARASLKIIPKKAP